MPEDPVLGTRLQVPKRAPGCPSSKNESLTVAVASMVASNSSDSGSNSANDNGQLEPLFNLMGGGSSNCDRPACDDTKSALTAALQRVRHRSSGKDASSESARGESSPRPTAIDRKIRRTCPPTRDEIGVSAWSLIHSMVRADPLQ